VTACDVTAVFTPDKLIIREGESITFANESTGTFAGNAKYNWDFGDGQILSRVDKSAQTHIFQDAGDYTVTLTALGSTECTSQTTRQVYVGGECTVDAAYTTNTNQVEVGGSVSFTDQSTGTPDTWIWDFDDGSTSQTRNPTHVFNAVGQYTVVLGAGKNGGCFSYAADRTITVVCNITAAFEPGDADIIKGETVQFVNMSSGSAVDADRATWSWDLNGDGVADSTSESPSYTYTSAGTYNVKLTATSRSAAGAIQCTDDATVTIVVNEPGIATPDAAFQASPSAGTAPLAVTVTDQSVCAGCTLVFWQYNFGDNSQVQEFTAQPEPFTHTYASSGIYDITLIVRTSENASDSIKQTINVAPPGASEPVAAFQASVDAQDPFTVHFTDKSNAQDGIIAWSWSFGDSTPPSTSQNPVHTYTQAGTYTVQLTVTSASQKQDTESQSVSVCANPTVTALFSASPVSGEIPLTAQFTDQSTSTCGGVTAWSWNFGDGGTASVKNPSHTYQTAGTYDVTLTVTGPGGKTGTLTKNDLILVSPAPAPEMTSPTLISPADGQTEVSLTPELKAKHVDEVYAHQKTHWRIQTETGESIIWTAENTETAVTETATLTAAGNLPELIIHVPDLFLDPNTHYQWSARVEGADGKISDWAQSNSFVTIASDPEDPEGTGVPVDQQPDEDDIEVLFPDLTPSDLTKFVNAAEGSGIIGVEGTSPVLEIVFLKSISASDAPNLEGWTFPWGFISFKLKVTPGATVQIEIHFSSPLPTDITWYKFRNDGSESDALVVYDKVTISQDRKVATVTLVDGGDGDLDQLVNGWIIDPIGYGVKKPTPSGDGDENGGGDGDTCFIGAAWTPWTLTGTAGILAGISMLAGLLLGFVMARRQR